MPVCQNLKFVSICSTKKLGVQTPPEAEYFVQLKLKLIDTDMRRISICIKYRYVSLVSLIVNDKYRIPICTDTFCVSNIGTQICLSPTLNYK